MWGIIMDRIKIKINDNFIVEAIPLAKYYREHKKKILEKKKFLFFNFEKYKYVNVKTPLWLVFIPYKHSLKEIIEIDESDIIENKFVISPAWVSIDTYISEAYDYPESQYKDRVKIRHFLGYRFIYDYNEFICNEVLHNKNHNLAILYKEMPELLNEEFDEE